MGADFVTKVVPKECRTTEEIRSFFERIVSVSRLEDGVSYSGAIGMKSAIEFRSEQFQSFGESYDWLDDHCEKWGPAVCVRFTDNDGGICFVIGALCPS